MMVNNMRRSLVNTLKPAHVLTKDQFEMLNKTADHVAWRHMFMRFLFNIFLVFLIIYMSHHGFYLGMMLVWAVYATQFHFWGSAGIGHELLHRRVFSSKLLNNIFYSMCSSLTWGNPAMFRDTHMLHHRDTFSIEDVEARSVKNWSTPCVLEYLLIDFRTMFRRLYYVTINSFGYYPNLTHLSHEYARSARITLVLNLALYLTFFLLVGDVIVTALLFISPFSCSLLNKILAKAQHHELEEYKDEGALKFSRTLILPKFLSFLYANMNFHAEHHFAPSVPFYNLAELHNILKAKGLVSSQSFYSFFCGEFQTVWLGLTKPKQTKQQLT